MSNHSESSLSKNDVNAKKGAQPTHWGGVVAMSLCVFALVASEFMPVSLLTPLSQELQVTQGMAGQGIAISGALAVITSLSITAISGSLDRKILLLLMTAMMAVSGVVVALAPNYLVYMVGRAMLGVVIGGFWSISAATAMRLVPFYKVSKALAIFNGGNALAVVIAAPLGSYLGSIIGWRGAFFCLVPVAIIALIWQWVSLPTMKPLLKKKRSINVFDLLKSKTIALGMSGCGLFFWGQFSLYTYVRPFLENVTQTRVSTLSLILLSIGISGLIGTALIGAFVRRNLYRTLFSIPVIMSIIAFSLMLLGADVVAVTALLCMWGIVATSAPVGWWTWIAEAAPENAELGGGMMVAVVQLSIAMGSTFGGLLFDSGGYRATFSASIVALLLSAVITYLTSRTGKVREGNKQ